MNIIYSNTPIWFQNILITVYGLKLRRERFGKKYQETLGKISLDHNPVDGSNYIFEFLMSAMVNVPFYRNHKDCNFLDARQHDRVDDFLKKFPILEKSVIRDNPKSLVSEKFNGDLISVSTSGSTGSPLKVQMDSDSRQINYAFFHKFLESIGVSEFERSATFAGRVLIPPKQNEPPFWRINKAMNTLLLSSYHIGEGSCKDYIKALESWDPRYIDSYPSAVYELAILLQNINYRPTLNLKAIITSSETLFSYQRELIEAVFRCPIFDYYGCAEQSVLAFQTPFSEGAYIVPGQYCLVEVLDEDYEPVPPGESGMVVCTNLFNSAAPIIRYKIGDNAVVSEYFPGSRFVKRLAKIEGRVDDVVVTPSGRRVGRLDPIFKGLEGIKEAQIIQESLTHLKINLVTLGGKPINEAHLKAMLIDRLGDEINMEVEYIESIPRTKSGKFRSVLSKI